MTVNMKKMQGELRKFDFCLQYNEIRNMFTTRES